MENNNTCGKQVGGSHYEQLPYQPYAFIARINANFFEGNIIKYLSRYLFKGTPKQDLQKAVHYIKMNTDLHARSVLVENWHKKLDEYSVKNHLDRRAAKAIYYSFTNVPFAAIESIEEIIADIEAGNTEPQRIEGEYIDIEQLPNFTRRLVEHKIPN